LDTDPQHMAVIEEARRILGVAEEDKATLRLIGGLAI